MKIRGAPAIGVAAALAVALGVNNCDFKSKEEVIHKLEKIIETLEKTRPTAVNLFWSLERMKKKAKEKSLDDVGKLKKALLDEALKVLK